MGLWEAIKNTVRGKADEVAEKLEDPIRDGKLAIKDSEVALKKFKEQIVQVKAQEKQMTVEVKAAMDESKKFLTIAKSAKEAGNEEDALRALERHNKENDRAKELDTDLKKIRIQIKNLQDQMEKRRDQISAAERNIKQLEARETCATIRKAAADANSQFGTSSDPFAKLNKLEGKIAEKEYEAEAAEEIAGLGEDDLEEKYGSTSKSDLKDQLANL